MADFKELMLYQATMSTFRKMLDEGLISKEEYDEKYINELDKIRSDSKFKKIAKSKKSK